MNFIEIYFWSMYSTCMKIAVRMSKVWRIAKLKGLYKSKIVLKGLTQIVDILLWDCEIKMSQIEVVFISDAKGKILYALC